MLRTLAWRRRTSTPSGLASLGPAIASTEAVHITRSVTFHHVTQQYNKGQGARGTVAINRLVRFDLDWFGLDWIGSVWFALGSTEPNRAVGLFKSRIK